MLVKPKKIKKYLITLLLLCLFSFPARAIDGENYIGEDEENNEEIKDLNKQIEDKKGELQKMQEKEKAYSDALAKAQSEKASLAGQLSILENRLAKAEIDISMAEIEIDRAKLEISLTNIEIEAKEKKIAEDKEHIENIIRLIYQNDQIGYLEALLLNDSFSDFINQLKYLEDVNGEVKKGVESLEKSKQILEEKKDALVENEKELKELKAELEEKEENLKEETNNKNFILEQTRLSENKYQNLLAEAKKEQQSAQSDIAYLEKTVREKIAAMEGQTLEFNDSGLIWPVPKNTITAYFHDPEYPYRYIFEHPAVDIRAGQGTTLKAAASGYVARTQLNGTNYGYIMIIHGDGLSTVYGHVSKIFVEEDEYVVQGQSIGASGGMPGTPGAGRLTTGPHLHFEVRLNGLPVNPLGYLP